MTERMSAYGKYQQSRNASWQCLIDCGVDRLPVVVSDIARQLSVKLCEYGDNEALLRQHLVFLRPARMRPSKDPGPAEESLQAPGRYI